MTYKIPKNIEACEALVARDEKVVARCQHLSYYPFAVESGKGEILKDADGNEYIDFLTSASSLNLGSSNPVITEAIRKQLEKCTQYTAAYTYNEPMISYAEKLTSVFPGGVKAKIAFGNCGSDGNDCAVKFARAYTGRTKIITFINGYHGNTYGSSSMTTCSTRMHAKMGPFLPEVYHFPFYGIDQTDEVVERECLKDMNTAFASYLPVDEVAAVIIEPVQGDAGILPAHPIFMKKLYDLCKAHGILFISEEVQQGFWRTGHFFGIENYPGIIPDGIIMGKSIGAGLTLGAFMARADIMDTLPAPAHLFTLGGNAIACAAGNAAFDYYESEEFKKQFHENMDSMKTLLAKLKEAHPKSVGNYRGYGMSYGLPIVKEDGDGNLVPDGDGTFKICFRADELGLIIITLGENILRIQPPLNISTANLARAFDILDQALTELEKGQIPDDVFDYRNGW